jgi:hypothetical protein
MLLALKPLPVTVRVVGTPTMIVSGETPVTANGVTLPPLTESEPDDGAAGDFEEPHPNGRQNRNPTIRAGRIEGFLMSSMSKPCSKLIDKRNG